MTLKRCFRLGMCGAVLGAVYLSLAASAMAHNKPPVWVRQLGSDGGDEATGVATDAAGNVYLTGSTLDSLGGANRGGSDAWVAKYDDAGDLLWTRQLGTEDHDFAYGVATDAAGNVYLTGLTFGSLGGAYGLTGDAWVAKYDAAGDELWVRQLGSEGGDEAYGVATDAAGNVYLTGYTSGSLGGANRGSWDAWVAKYDAAGDVLWVRQLGTKTTDQATGVATDAAGNVYLTGYTWGSLHGANRGRSDAWVAKYDADGHVLWKRQLGTVTDDRALGVATDAAGNVYLTGYTSGSLGGAHRGHPDAWVAKYDTAGRKLWTRQLGTESLDVASGVATDVAGNVYLVGGTRGSLGGANRGTYDAWVVKYDAAGHLLWKRQLGTKSHDDAYGVATDAAGNVYLTGLTYGSLGGPNQGQEDAWVAKYPTQP